MRLAIRVLGNRFARCGSRPASPGALQAFTLIEVMLTMGLLMILIASSMSLLVYLNNAAGRLADHTAATAVVLGRLEAIRAATYSPPIAPFYVASTVSITNEVKIAMGKNGSFLAPGTLISKVEPKSAGHLVTVTGTFQARGKPLVIELQSFVNRYAGGQQ
jgi:type II secretory pathway pseudopilin PulG